ncbi:hypothetical protein QBC41DRAFT_134171 [Cercophora samala]|uniref:Uncharacterized protein n=1 Tax=Cercophora samala TaxID=330535 RepID=A0AA39ZB37_9PEZI|nr:hypothetical protein QBC41DRAFT_134171 [Cercophora samala]
MAFHSRTLISSLAATCGGSVWYWICSRHTEPMDMGDLPAKDAFFLDPTSAADILFFGRFSPQALSLFSSLFFQQLASSGLIYAVFISMLVCSGSASFLPVHRSFSCFSLDMHIIIALRCYLIPDTQMTDLNYLMGQGV